MIQRRASETLARLAQWYPAVAVTGPRQAGKTTLARAAFPTKPYVSLEDPDQRLLASEDARRFLVQFPNGAVLDEVQRVPELFSWLQTRLDSDSRTGQFILTGSYQFGLREGLSQSLAGRVGHLHLLPFGLEERYPTGVVTEDLESVLWRGSYPPVHDRGIPPAVWFADYVTTYIERDLRQIVNVRDLSTFQRFLRMCAARTGQLLNLSALASDCGVTHNTAKAWISALEASYLIVLLPPWHRNLGKRLVKTPKLYFLDTGLAAWLAGVRQSAELSLGALRGPLFETWVVSEVVKFLRNRGRTEELYFWRDAHGHEVDLLLEFGTEHRLTLECKSGQTVAADWKLPLETFASLAPGTRSAVLYGGQTPATWGEIAITPWTQLTSLLHSCLPTEGPPVV